MPTAKEATLEYILTYYNNHMGSFQDFAQDNTDLTFMISSFDVDLDKSFVCCRGYILDFYVHFQCILSS